MILVVDVRLTSDDNRMVGFTNNKNVPIKKYACV